MTSLNCVLFDLDGTLLDTAPDLADALNQLRQQHHLNALPLADIRHLAGHGSAALLKIGMNVSDQHPHFTALLEEFFRLYQARLTNAAQLFQGIDTVLHYLDTHLIPWGIVTNRPSRFTFDLLKHFKLEHRAQCIICGDTLTKRKPDPAPILHACELLKQPPSSCLYIGDTQTDVIASKAAGTRSLVTLYGYQGAQDQPRSWNADAYVETAHDIIPWIKHFQSAQAIIHS